jgi:CBS-domain-containing membrane protein
MHKVKMHGERRSAILHVAEKRRVKAMSIAIINARNILYPPSATKSIAVIVTGNVIQKLVNFNIFSNFFNNLFNAILFIGCVIY